MEASSGPVNIPQGDALLGKLPPDAGEWLFKDNEQVLGPVPAEMLLGKLYEGYVNADTPVAREVGQWKPLREVWFLGAHVTRARQKLALDTAIRERAELSTKHTRLRILMAAVTFAMMFVSSLALARWTMIARPWEDKTDWLARRPEFATLPDRTPRVAVVDNRTAEKKDEATPAAVAEPQKEAAHAANDDDDRRGRRDRDRDRKRGKDRDRDDKKPAKKDDKTAEKDDGLKTSGPTTAGIPTDLTPEQMKATFLGGKGGYISCIKEEAARNPGMPATVTVEFVIRNDGSTGDFKVQEREVRSGPLATCLGARIGALRFPRFSGERRTFIFPFTIKRK